MRVTITDYRDKRYSRWRHDDHPRLGIPGEKKFNGATTELIANEALLRLGIHISATAYLEDGAPRLTEITGDDEQTSEDGTEAETVSNSEEATKKKGGLYVKRRGTRGLLLSLAAARPYAPPSASAVPVPLPAARRKGYFYHLPLQPFHLLVREKFQTLSFVRFPTIRLPCVRCLPVNLHTSLSQVIRPLYRRTHLFTEYTARLTPAAFSSAVMPVTSSLSRAPSSPIH